MSNPSVPTATKPDPPSAGNLAHEGWEYWIDACQRAVLFLNVLQQRSDRYQEHNAKVAQHVLKFGCELVMDGRKLQRPVALFTGMLVAAMGGIDAFVFTAGIGENAPVSSSSPASGHVLPVTSFQPARS